MKRNVAVLKFWFFICSNLWYVPALLLLLYIKVSLISMLGSAILAETAGRGQGGSGSSGRSGSLFLVSGHQTRFKRNQGQGLRNGEKIREKVIKNQGKVHGRRGGLTEEDVKVLENLERWNILPTNENRTDPDGIWLVLNQVPRGGGGLIREILQRLQEDNGFKHLEHEYRTPWNRFLLEEEQKNLVTWFEYQHLPKSYERHFFFVNFTKYQQYILEPPIYVNMVRDPATRIRSTFEERRKTKEMAIQEIRRRNKLQAGSGDKWFKLDFATCVLENDPECEFLSGSQDFTLSVPFFCGQFNACVEINNKWALQAAKFNIEKYYSVVAVYESLEDSLRVLEKYIPKFFSGATKLGMSNIVEESIDDNVRGVLEKKLPYEFELYNFIGQRLEKQLIYIYNNGKEKLEE